MRRILLFIVMILCLLPKGKEDTITDSLKRASTDVGVPYGLLRAICYVESELKLEDVVYDDGGVDNHAIGFCQVLLDTAKHLGWKYDARCVKHLNPEARTYENCTLYGPYTNAYWAAKELKFQLTRYNNDWVSAIAAYNAGSVKTCTTGRVTKKKDGSTMYTCEIGKLYNQKYVDKVMRAFKNGN